MSSTAALRGSRLRTRRASGGGDVYRVRKGALVLAAAAAVVGVTACGSSQQTTPVALTTARSIASVPAPTSTPQETVAPLTLAPIPPTAAPTARPTAAPTARPTAAPTAIPTAPPKSLCGAPANPWNYNFCGGGTISAPPSNFCDYFICIPSFWQSTKGYVEQCQDGMYSHSGGRSGSCSSHGGNLRPLNP